MMDSKQSKALIAVGVFLCFIIAGHKLYNFYQGTKPVAQVGECLQLFDPRVNGQIQIEILKNDDKNKESEVAISFSLDSGPRVYGFGKVPYKELRESGAEKVECVR